MKAIMMKKVKVFMVSSLFALTLAGCSNADVGTVGGAVVGGVVGSQFGGGAGRTAATIGGAVVGGFVGRKIGESSDY